LGTPGVRSPHQIVDQPPFLRGKLRVVSIQGRGLLQHGFGELSDLDLAVTIPDMAGLRRVTLRLDLKEIPHLFPDGIIPQDRAYFWRDRCHWRLRVLSIGTGPKFPAVFPWQLEAQKG